MINNKKIVFTTGKFEFLHPGHLYFLEKARGLGESLRVFLNDDDSFYSLNGRAPFHNQKHRKLLLESLQFVNDVRLFASEADLLFQVQDLILKHSGENLLFVKGNDYDLSLLNPELKLCLDKSEVPICFIPTLEKNTNSSSIIYEKVTNGK